MTAKSTAKIFMHGRSQAVRLPKEFRLPGKEVRVRRVGNGVLLEPIEKKFDFDRWLARVQALAGPDFLPEGRPEQPPWPDDDDEISFD
jgi:antitoxin VapB